MARSKRSFVLNFCFISLAAAGIITGIIFLITSFFNRNLIRNPLENNIVERVHLARHNVLFLSSYDPIYPTILHQINGIATVFEKNNISFDIEYMDVKKFGTEKNVLNFYESLKYKLDNSKKYDVVLLGDDAALIFAQRFQRELFDGIPLVFFCIDNFETAQQAIKNPMITGSAEKYYISDTIKIACKLNPHAKRVIAIVDDSATGIGDKHQFMEESKNFPELEFGIINTSEKSVGDLAAIFDVMDKSHDTIVLYMSFTSDLSGTKYDISSAVDFMTKYIKNVPIYRFAIGGLGQGIFGGKIYDYYGAGLGAANMAVDIINGKRVSDIELDTSVGGNYYFDWNLIRKFNFQPSYFPENTIFLNKTNSYWEKYKSVLIPLILITISLVILLIASFIGYLRARRSEILVTLRNNAIDRKNRMLKESAQKLKSMTEKDYLTDIPNRLSSVEMGRKCISDGRPFSALLMDLDDFKNINDYYTHVCGDALLQDFAKRLVELTNEMDCFVARHGGDEFLLIYKNGFLTEGNPDLETIRLIVNQPFFYGSVKMDVKVSGGIAHYKKGISFDELVSNADVAMVEAKKSGKNIFVFFTDEMRNKIYEKNQIAEILQESCKNKGFSIRYQPQIDSATGEIHGYEALCRLENNLVGPAQFIPVAEEGGYITSIGRIVTEKVIAQMAEWREKGVKLRKVAINYSNGQLVDAEYVNYLKSLLHKYNIPSDLVEIEITESLFMGNTNLAHKLFDNLSNIGVKLALDDFGTGYSSLSYLTYLPVSKVKIDKSLVDNYLVDGKDSFIKNIVRLVHDLGMELTVEGVEQKWQFERLKKLHCDYIQGYYFSKPITGEEVESFDPSDKIKESV